MWEVLQDLKEVLGFGWFGSIIGLVSLALAIILYRRSIREGRPTCYIQNSTILGVRSELPSDKVRIFFEGQQVDKLIKTNIIFWNSGRAAIRGSDIVAVDPIRIIFEPGSKILSIQINKMNNISNSIHLSKSEDFPDQVIMKFDYLNPEDGINMEILHNSARNEVKLVGRVIGLKNGIQNNSPKSDFSILYIFYSRQTFLMKYLSAVAALTFILSMLLFYDPTLFSIIPQTDKKTSPGGGWAFLFSSIIIASVPGVFFYSRWRRFPRSLAQVDELK
jgi:hypothetical protein